VQSLGDPEAVLAGAQVTFGPFIEVSITAIFTQRFFAR
jgi:hypothetical protein